MWSELRDDKHVIKMKAEAVSLANHPSVVNPTNAPPLIQPDEIPNLIRAERQVGDECEQESPTIYREGWVCLNLRTRDDNNACENAYWAQQWFSDEEKNDLHPAFLAERFDRTGLQYEDFVAPAIPENLSGKLATELSATDVIKLGSGVTCPSCNSAILRLNLVDWTCGSCGSS
jgi:hypothetical protein